MTSSFETCRGAGANQALQDAVCLSKQLASLYHKGGSLGESLRKCVKRDMDGRSRLRAMHFCLRSGCSRLPTSKRAAAEDY